MSGLPLSLSLSLLPRSSRRSLPSLCSIVDECSVEIEIQSTPRIYLYCFVVGFFFSLKKRLFLRVTPCCKALTVRLWGLKLQFE